MSKKTTTILWVAIAFLAVVGGTYYLARARALDEAEDRFAALNVAVSERDHKLIGFLEYKTFIESGKKALSGQTKLLAARVERPERFTRLLTRGLWGLSSQAVIEVSYLGEYSVGYNLEPGTYEVRETANGIEVVVGRPELIATPAAKDLKHRVIVGGVLVDESEAMVRLQRDAVAQAIKRGGAIAKDEAVVALCEKRLVMFLHDFLAKQPKVAYVPHIQVTYRK